MSESGNTCGAPCPYGGSSSSRKYSRADLGAHGYCNRRVAAEGLRCYQHRENA